MMQDMELRHLHTFTAAAERQSFTRAAEHLAMTQAAVSQHIAALEKELRVSLFHRASRAVTLTEAGRRLYDYARRILDLIDEARREIGQTKTALKGTLRIAASSVPAEVLLPELLLRFHQSHPEVRESVQVSDSEAAREAVENGEADLGLVGEWSPGSRLSARPIGEDEMVLVTAPDHPLARKRKVTLEHLRAEPLIVREPGSGTRRCVDRALESAGLDPGELRVVLEMNSNDAIRGAVERGLGVAFLSRTVAARDIQAKRLAAVPVQGVRPQRRLYLLSDPDRIPPPAVRAFLTVLDAWLGETPASV